MAVNHNSLLTVASFSFPYQAEIARLTLQREGITAFVVDANTINMQWLYSHAMGGVRVQVAQRDLLRAQRVLATDYSSLVESETGSPVAPTCAHCGGVLQPHTRGKKPAFMVFLLLGFPLFWYKRGVKCSQCATFTPSSKT